MSRDGYDIRLDESLGDQVRISCVVALRGRVCGLCDVFCWDSSGESPKIKFKECSRLLFGEFSSSEAAEEKSGVFGEIFEFYCSSGTVHRVLFTGYCSSGTVHRGIVHRGYCSSSGFPHCSLSFLQFQSIVKSLDGFRTVRIARLSIIPFSYKRFRDGRRLEVVAREGAVLEAVVGRARGRGQVVDFPADSGESVAPSVAIASVTQSISMASDASVGLGAGAAPGWGGAPAQGP
ncbi:unnamed protein product [Microthlaspi erraticum]|uniref:Uncharacterized protein n=1 Tax=Microthlaspi erraticum TaxID=1685480 RepID=A0A6D2KK49_9BRAS|nr:unnamed protein product [Microthlaspi erraticum]